MEGNRKIYWKEVSNEKGVKVKSCSRIKDGNRKLGLGEGEVRRVWNIIFKSV